MFLKITELFIGINGINYIKKLWYCVKIKYNYTNFSEKVAVNHIHIELTADFENTKLTGFVDLSLIKKDETCDHIV